MSLDIEELESKRNDYRRANGAPQIVDRNGKNQRFSRPSSFAKPLDDESALVSWKIDRACIGVAYDRALQARWCAVDDEDRDGRGKLREDSIAAGRGAEAADVGTALHAMSVRWEKGEAGFAPPEPYITSLAAYSKELRRLGLETTHYEFHTVNEEYRTAGTADRLYVTTQPLISPDGDVLPVGTRLIGDLKTGGKLEYSRPAYAVQLALYAGGSLYDVVTDHFMETPDISQQWAIVVHMPADDPGVCEFLWVDLEVGRWGCYLVDQIKRWRRMWRSGEYEMPPVQLDSDLIRSFHNDYEPETTLDGELVVAQPNLEDDELTSWVEWAQMRLHYIGQHDKARAHLQLIWPVGLPTPKQGIDDMTQIAQVMALLSQIEAEYQLGFVERPQALVSTGPSTRNRKE